MLLTSGKSGLALVMPTSEILKRARDLRWEGSLNFKGMDAIHVATAMHMRCDEIWTRDGRIYKARDAIAQWGVVPMLPKDTKVLPDGYRVEPLFTSDEVI
jgi:hypothetical protein